MSSIGQPERATQNRVIALFRNELGYRFLGNWTDRANTKSSRPCSPLGSPAAGTRRQQIAATLYRLRTEADNHDRTLYGNNQAVYSLLRYGVPVKTEAGKATETVHLIDWEEPEKNDFAIAEEVTLKGDHERRPDLVLYVNGIAIGVIELKNSRVSIGDGIRQMLSNQQPEFNAWFFATVQFVFAGNDSEGLQYGTIGTAEKYFLSWKEDEADNSRFKLDKYLLKMCRKDRLIELMHDFVLFDGGDEETAARRTNISASRPRRSMCASKQGRHHLAHAGQRQEHRHGAAGQVDSGEQSERPRRHHHRPRRTGQADRARLHRGGRDRSSAPAAAAT